MLADTSSAAENRKVEKNMEYAVFALLVASGICLTFSAMMAVYAIRTLEKARQFLCLAWDVIHSYDSEEVFAGEGTE